MDNQPAQPALLTEIAQTQTSLGGRATYSKVTEPEGNVAWTEDAFVRRVFYHWKSQGKTPELARGNMMAWIGKDAPDNLNHHITVEHFAARAVNEDHKALACGEDWSGEGFMRIVDAERVALDKAIKRERARAAQRK